MCNRAWSWTIKVSEKDREKGNTRMVDKWETALETGTEIKEIVLKGLRQIAFRDIELIVERIKWIIKDMYRTVAMAIL